MKKESAFADSYLPPAMLAKKRLNVCVKNQFNLNLNLNVNQTSRAIGKFLYYLVFIAFSITDISLASAFSLYPREA